MSVFSADDEWLIVSLMIVTSQPSISQVKFLAFPNKYRLHKSAKVTWISIFATFIKSLIILCRAESIDQETHLRCCHLSSSPKARPRQAPMGPDLPAPTPCSTIDTQPRQNAVNSCGGLLCFARWTLSLLCGKWYTSLLHHRKCKFEIKEWNGTEE